ncbi:GIY-YIG nuclease family protein [Candidatus Gottesmanbacteria bacterium]|nr:GIY-YIG nuclease family protein [Candidatus Gottesmanbacteria bacterium]
MYYVYVLYGRTYNRFYIGYTDNLQRRVKEHKFGKSRTTRLMGDLYLIYYEASLSKKDALIREKQLKTGFGRGYLRRRLKYSIEDD